MPSKLPHERGRGCDDFHPAVYVGVLGFLNPFRWVFTIPQ